MALTNAEKQVRYRKKEELNKYVNKILRDCQLKAWNPRLQGNFGNIEAQLREAAHLPSGWTDEDLKRAADRLGKPVDALKRDKAGRRQFCSDRCEKVTPVKGGRDVGGTVVDAEQPGPRMVTDQGCKESVIRSHEPLVSTLHNDWLALAADARIDDGQKNPGPYVSSERRKQITCL